MKVKISDVQRTLVKIILDKSQLSETDANILASDYLEGELQGEKSHGLAAFPVMVEKLPAGKASFKLLKETGSFIYADAEGSFGAIVGRKLADLAIDNKAREQGVAVAVVREMKSWLRPGVIAQYIADRDMIGWVVNTGGSPMVAPPGGETR